MCLFFFLISLRPSPQLKITVGCVLLCRSGAFGALIYHYEDIYENSVNLSKVTSVYGNMFSVYRLHIGNVPLLLLDKPTSFTPAEDYCRLCAAVQVRCIWCIITKIT